jgi:hypothetical protein
MMVKAVGCLMKQKAAARAFFILRNGGELEKLIGKSRVGKEWLRVLISENVDFQGLEHLVNESTIEQASTRFISTAGKAILSGRASPVIMQGSAFIVLPLVKMEYIPFMWKALAGGWISKEKEDEYAARSPRFKHRIRTSYWDRMTPGAAGTLAGVFKDENFIGRALALGLAPARWADKKIIGMVYRTIELYGEAQGMSPEEIIFEAETAVDKSQATLTKMTQSQMNREAAAGHFLPKILTLFSRDIQKIAELVRHNFREFGESAKLPKDYEKVLWTMLTVLVLLPIWRLFSLSAGRTFTKAAGAFVRGRSPEDLLSETIPWQTHQITTLWMQNVSENLFGPLSRPLADALTSAAYVAADKGTMPNQGNPMSQAADYTLRSVMDSIRLIKSLSEEVKRGYPPEEAVLRISANLGKGIAMWGGAPVVMGDLIQSAGRKERPYYYDMFYRSLYHSNGVRRSETNHRTRGYALRKLYKLGARQQDIKAALEARIAEQRR